MTVQPWAELIRDVADFPKPGVMFKDITPLLASPGGFAGAVEAMCLLSPEEVDIVVGLEARGFILAAPVALALGAGFVPIRKPGKLPGPTVDQSYALEYGTETLMAHADAFTAGARVLVVDDVADTGHTLALVQEVCSGSVKEVRSAVLYRKPRSVVAPEYVWRHTDKWIDFPWSSDPPVDIGHHEERPAS